MQVAGSLFQSHSTASTRSCATRSDVRCTQRNGVVVSAKNGDSFAKPSVEEPALLADPEAKFKRYGKDFGKRHIVDTNWLQSSPQVRVRHAVDRAREQLLELAVLNERLTGASPWQIRHRADFLRSSIRNWDMLAQYVTAYDVSMTLDGIEEASRKVDEMLASERQDVMSITNLKDELTQLHGQVEAAQQQLNMTQSRVQQNLQRVEDLKSEAATLEALRQLDIEEPKLPVEPASSAVTAIPETAVAPVPATLPALVPVPAVPEATPVPKSKPEHRGSKFPKRGARGKGRNRGLQSSLRIESGLKNFWFPAMFSSRLQADMMIPFDLCGEAWVLFRDENGKAACIFDQCAHRACPLSLGTVENGQVACPYHGWEFNREGSCTKMPSTMHCNGVGVRALQCKEKYGFVWVWPGEGEPDAEIPDTLCPPPSYTIHAEIVVEVPVEHGLLVENLLDLAHAPFTHTTTFARDWPIPDAVRFKTLQMLGGHWDPYPIDMAFQPPAMTISKIGLAQPGKPASAPRADMCERHLHQVHVCLPSRPGHTRLLYRMALDFWPWIMHVPFIDKVWENVAAQVLGEDLVLVEGQQDRMQRGGDTWNHPVQYDKLAVAYRRWRNRVGDAEVPAKSELRKTVTMNAGELFLLEDDELHADK